MKLRLREYKPRNTKKHGYVDTLPIMSSICHYYCKCSNHCFTGLRALRRHMCSDVHKRWMRCLNRPKSTKVEVQVFLVGGDPEKRVVTKMRLQRAKSRAIRQIYNHQDDIIAMFTKVASETNTNSYRC